MITMSSTAAVSYTHLAQEKDLIVVMPSALNSFYTNWPEVMMGIRVCDYIVEELMPLVYNWFPASDRPQDNFIAGLSMGAIGTAKFAANYPQRFAAAAAFSAAPVNLHQSPDTSISENIVTQLKKAHGGIEGAIHSVDNTWDLLVERKKEIPPMYFTCGTDDPHYPALYLPFKAHALANDLPMTFEEIEGYTHEWRFWDKAIEKAFAFFQL